MTDKLLLLANFSCREPSPKRQSTKLPPATGSWKENLPLHASCGGLGPWFLHRARPQLPCDFSLVTCHAGVRGWPLHLHEHIPGLRQTICRTTFQQDRPASVPAPPADPAPGRKAPLWPPSPGTLPHWLHLISTGLPCPPPHVIKIWHLLSPGWGRNDVAPAQGSSTCLA